MTGVRPPASAQQIQQWEDEHYPYKLPDDLKAFLAFSNGVEAAWDILLRPGATPICGAGRLRINDVAHLQRLPLDADDQAALGGDPAPPLGFCAVDGSDQSKSGTSQVWLQEPGGMWCAIADDITCYLRLAAAHAYVHGWHHAYAPAGLSPPTERLLALVAPARLQFDQEMLHDAEGALD
ncbi:hypothetical protein JKP88DRAFT_276776 [Tribonema minus]|uniref:Knr4/Smi1-like domain-containing protein n=1 Tax=Tribonema minus TaxID=303371 RepID=A0A836CHG4_9STRA|nr:hypothetical protein JKP88DRAFT_276776 [Tribonema minus]